MKIKASAYDTTNGQMKLLWMGIIQFLSNEDPLPKGFHSSTPALILPEDLTVRIPEWLEKDHLLILLAGEDFLLNLNPTLGKLRDEATTIQKEPAQKTVARFERRVLNSLKLYFE